MEKYYILNMAGEQEGPYSQDEIWSRMCKGEYSREMLVKCGEMGTWKALGSLFLREEASSEGVSGGAAVPSVPQQNELPAYESPQKCGIPEIEFAPLPAENHTVMPEYGSAESPAAPVPYPGIVNVVELSFMLNVPGRGQEGPLRESVIRERLSHGMYPAGTLIVGAGMDSWEPLESLFPNVKVAVAAVPPPLPQMASQRMYYVCVMGKGQTGPYPGDLLQLQVQTGVCPPGTLIWTEGMPGWEPIERYFSIGGMVGAGHAVTGVTFGSQKTETYLPHVSFICCFRRYFKVSGRACRAEFWWFWFLFLLCYLIVVVAAESRADGFAVVFSLLSILMLIPLLTALVRRMHDAGNPGIVAFVPVINLIMAMFPSEGPNMYGSGPAKPYDK